VVVGFPLKVYRGGEELGLIHSVEERLEADFPDASEQTKVEELIRQAEFDRVGSPPGKEFRDWAVRIIERLQSEGYVVGGSVVHGPHVSFGLDKDNPSTWPDLQAVRVAADVRWTDPATRKRGGQHRLPDQSRAGHEMTDDLSELQARLDRLSSKDRELLGRYFVQDQYGHDELGRQRILWAAKGVDVALLDLIDSIATSKEQRSRVLRLIKEGSTSEG
jgi:hypothetical protein